MIKTTLLVILIAIIATFAGCQPLSDWKDSAIDKFNEWNSTPTTTITATAITVTPTPTTVNPITTTTAKITTTIPKPTYKNPSWEQLKAFLLEDKTDELPYIYPTFVCQDFAEALQRNAKQAGWRCALVRLDMTGYTDPYKLGIKQNAGHACNAFETTDRGLVFIDCTGDIPGTAHPSNGDALVVVSKGGRYIPTYIFPNGGWYFADMGLVVDYTLSW